MLYPQTTAATLLNMPLNRRQFLKTFAVSAVGSGLISCTHKKFLNVDEDIFLSGGSYLDGEKTQHALIVINMTQQEKRVIDIAFLAHGIYIDPRNKYRVFCFEKNGHNACEIDLQTKAVVRQLQADNNQLFSGHASFSKDGKTLYCVETNKDNRQGSISIRNTETFVSTHQLPTLGLEPHDCQLKDNVLTVSNTGSSGAGFHTPSLVSIDLTTEKLIERIRLDDQQLNCGHFEITDNNDIVIASAPINTDDKTALGGISFRQENKDTITMSQPDVVIQRMTGEALSIAIDNKNQIAAISHPEANLLTFWSMKDKKIIKAFGFEKPRGISQTLDKKNFVISYSNKSAMVKIDMQDLTPQVDSIIQPTLASGEHLLNWSVSLRDVMPKRLYN
ncbi:MAG: DUF1513 domain-containing protein [Gammaproteobacteria bacterium]|nr:DUF1513 domain-containing protein [Gammaproteobacteria bacterium]